MNLRVEGSWLIICDLWCYWLIEDLQIACVYYVNIVQCMHEIIINGRYKVLYMLLQDPPAVVLRKKRYFSARGINKPCRKCLKRKCRSACIIYYKAFIIQRQQRLGWGWWSFTWWFFLSCRDEVIVTNEQSFGLWWWLSVPYIKYYIYTNVSISIWLL